ncbi:hypothetical protein [Actinotalea subterranea]|uniref:hypothetical protein n=1 Tax=Actinotalea subterranea TaxID=2607497 RepID=UPI0011EBEEDE|nr:hypothetical protein [Actinotalea subterranea]
MSAVARAPWWLKVLGVYAAARIVSAVILMAVARTQEANLWTPAAPSYAQYTGLMWDASWYRSIAETGYPGELPRGADGLVQQNPWAFFPLFPALCRLLMQVTGAPWEVVAPTLALVLGAAAMLVVHRTVAAALARPGGPGPAVPGGTGAGVVQTLPLATVALLSVWASAPVLQVGYTESLALLLLAATLWCLVVRRYGAALPLVLALGLTRAVALPVAVAVVAHLVVRWRQARAGAAWPRPERVGGAVLLLAALASGVLWPAVCGLVTGELDAYGQTQAAWRGRDEVVPLLPWLDVARWLLGSWGPVVLVLLVGVAALAVATRPMARLGPELQGWSAGYVAYLLLVVEPGTSLVRFSLLAWPVAGVLALVALRSRLPRTALAAMVVVGVLGQVAWVALLWRLVPPSGWPP